MNFPFLQLSPTRIAAAVGCAALCSAISTPAAAQSAMDKGAVKMMAPNCQVIPNVLRENRPAIAMLAVFSPTAVGTLVNRPAGGDEVSLAYCGQELRAARCTVPLIGLMGDSILTLQPGGLLVPPSTSRSATAFGIFGATAGMVLGGLANRQQPIWGGITGAVKGGAIGAGTGAGLDYTAQIARCTRERKQLDAISQRLVGPLGAIDGLAIERLRDVLTVSMQERKITQAESNMVWAAVAGMLRRIDMIDAILSA